MTAPSAHHVAASLTQDALAAVFDASAVSALREDSPLAALGMSDADVVCVADALAAAARGQGLWCVLDDADLGQAETVSDLIAAVTAKLAESEGVAG
jgi:hypothetical protein